MSVEEILGKIILIPFFIIYVLLMSKHRYSKKTTNIIAPVIIISYFIVTFLIIKKLYFLIEIYPVLDLLYRYLNMILMTVFAMILTRQRLVRSIFITASAFVSILLIGVIAMAIFNYTGISEVYVRIILHVIIGLILFWVRKPFTETLERIKKGWWLLCSIPAFLITSFLFITSLPVSLERNPSNLPAALTLSFTTIIIYITFIFILKVMYNESITEQSLMAQQIFVSSLERRSELIEMNLKSNMIFRHDVRHYIRMLSVCAENGDLDEIKNLLNKLDNDMSIKPIGLTIKTMTGCRQLDAIISYYTYIAEEFNIRITLNIDFINNDNVDMTELAVVLSNALENAVMECKKQNDKEKRKITLIGNCCGEQYLFEIINTCNSEVVFDSKTGLPKNNSGRKGIGSRSIAMFAKKYNAILQYKFEKGNFHLRLLF